MRYPEAKIKEAILHPDIEIRDRAVSYFGKSFSTDNSLMPLVIKAVETYGTENDAYRLIGASRDLPQTEETIAWVIDELNDPQSDQYENYSYNMSKILVRTGPRAKRILLVMMTPNLEVTPNCHLARCILRRSSSA
jgi:hypothetical protein